MKKKKDITFWLRYQEDRVDIFIQKKNQWAKLIHFSPIHNILTWNNPVPLTDKEYQLLGCTKITRQQAVKILESIGVVLDKESVMAWN